MTSLDDVWDLPTYGWPGEVIHADLSDNLAVADCMDDEAMRGRWIAPARR